MAFLVSRPWSQAEELRGDAHSENEPARDEYPIRHAWTFVIPPAPADQSAAHVKLVLCSLPPLVLELLEPTRLSEMGDVDIEPTMPIPLHGSAA